MKKFVHFLKVSIPFWFKFCQPKVGQCKTIFSFSLKAKWWRLWMSLSLYCRILHYSDYCISVRHNMLFFFEKKMLYKMDDGYWEWCGVRVIWPGSDEVLLRTTKHTTMETSWWRTFAFYWPPPSQLGPPSQAWPVAPSNPMQHLHIPEWWIGAHAPSFLWHT